MTSTKTVPLNKALLFGSLHDPSIRAAARQHMRQIIDQPSSRKQERRGWTLLEISANNGWADEVDHLLKHGADARANNGAAFQWAANNGHAAIVRLLLDHGADIHVHDDWALRRAASNGHVDVVRLLLDSGATATALDNGALCEAASRAAPDIVSLLLAHGADVNVGNNEPLRMAICRNCSSTAAVLLMAGANVNQAIAGTGGHERVAALAALDACAAAIPADQRHGLLKKYGEQLPALMALVRQEHRRSSRSPP